MLYYRLCDLVDSPDVGKGVSVKNFFVRHLYTVTFIRTNLTGFSTPHTKVEPLVIRNMVLVGELFKFCEHGVNDQVRGAAVSAKEQATAIW